MKEGVRYIEDILEDVRVDKKMTKKEMKELWKLHLEYQKVLMDKEDCLSIFLPKLGILYFNSFYNKVLFYKHKKGFSLDKNKLIEEEVKNHTEGNTTSLFTYPQQNRPVFYKVIKQIYKVFLGILKNYTTKRRAIRLIEKFNNNTLEKSEFNEQTVKNNKVQTNK